MKKLLSCPFCGKSVGKLTHARDLADEPDDYMHSDSWAVLCDAQRPLGPGGCGASGGFFPTEAEAIAAWNRRTPAPVAAPSEPRQGAEPSLRVEIGAVLFPATDGDEYGDPEIEPNMNALEALQERITPFANSKSVTLPLFVEVAALASGTPAGAPAVKDERADFEAWARRIGLADDNQKHDAAMGWMARASMGATPAAQSEDTAISEVRRYHIASESGHIVATQQGAWVLYDDHVAAIRAAMGATQSERPNDEHDDLVPGPEEARAAQSEDTEYAAMYRWLRDTTAGLAWLRKHANDMRLSVAEWDSSIRAAMKGAES